MEPGARSADRAGTHQPSGNAAPGMGLLRLRGTAVSSHAYLASRNPPDRRSGRRLNDERHLVHVAPAPVFAWLERADQRVAARVMMGGRVAVGRVVAAADMAALQADAQVQPHASRAQAVLAAGGGLRQLGERDRVEVGTAVQRGLRSSEGLPPRRARRCARGFARRAAPCADRAGLPQRGCGRRACGTARSCASCP